MKIIVNIGTNLFYKMFGKINKTTVIKTQIFNSDNVQKHLNSYFVWVEALTLEKTICVVAYHLNKEQTKEYLREVLN